jgi:hypothetical protein
MKTGWFAERFRRRLAIGLALGFFALRALVPVGFMLSVGPAQAAITLCPEFGQLPAAAGLHHSHHDHGGGLQVPGAQAHGACPFASAGHTAWHVPASVRLPAACAVGALARARAGDRPVAVGRLELSKAPRGPPVLNPA